MERVSHRTSKAKPRGGGGRAWGSELKINIKTKKGKTTRGFPGKREESNLKACRTRRE